MVGADTFILFTPFVKRLILFFDILIKKYSPLRKQFNTNIIIACVIQSVIISRK